MIDKIRYYSFIATGIAVACFISTAPLLTRLRSFVPDPIFSLTQTARDIVKQKNYSLRATKTTDDEVGALVGAFNTMLGEIEA